MTLLRIVAASLLLLTIHGFRIAPKKNGFSSDLPASGTCHLASGYGLAKGCVYSTAIEPLPACEDANFDEACYATSYDENVSMYTRDVRTANDYSRLTELVAEVEGGGFGLTVSAGLSAVKASEVSEKSVAFFIGASGTVRRETIARAVAMKLTPEAKALLTSDPQGFILRHGLRYVYSVKYGGSFMGSVTVNSRDTSDESNVSVFGSFSVNRGLFSARGSGEFNDMMSRYSTSISSHATSKWVGGSNIGGIGTTPEELLNQFTGWDNSWHENPAPLTVALRNWVDSAEVQGIVNSMPKNIQELFRPTTISPVVTKLISEENAKVSMTLSSVDRALNWEETQQHEAGGRCLRDLRRLIITKKATIDLLDEPSILVVQVGALAGDYTWFEAETFRESYFQCVELILTTTTQTTTKVAVSGEYEMIHTGMWCGDASWASGTATPEQCRRHCTAAADCRAYVTYEGSNSNLTCLAYYNDHCLHGGYRQNSTASGTIQLYRKRVRCNSCHHVPCAQCQEGCTSSPCQEGEFNPMGRSWTKNGCGNGNRGRLPTWCLDGGRITSNETLVAVTVDATETVH